MSDGVIKSVRGVYYDLSKSPYEYHTPYGDLFKFSSRKKLEMYTRDVVKEVERVTRLLERHNLIGYLTDDLIETVYKATYAAFYRQIER